MKIIYLTSGEEVLVDDEDYDFLSKSKWFNTCGYAVSFYGRKKMHRLIMNPPNGMLIDHINRNKLDNRKSNLRIVTKEMNVHNQIKRLNTKNNYKGVNFVEKTGLYQARCRMWHEDHFLGHFKTEEAAALAYNKKAIELSDCALLNNVTGFGYFNDEYMNNNRARAVVAERKSSTKGVYWNVAKKLWECKIRDGNKYKYIGSFKEEIDGIHAVNNTIKEMGLSL